MAQSPENQYARPLEQTELHKLIWDPENKRPLKFCHTDLRDILREK